MGIRPAEDTDFGDCCCPEDRCCTPPGVQLCAVATVSGMTISDSSITTLTIPGGILNEAVPFEGTTYVYSRVSNAATTSVGGCVLQPGYFSLTLSIFCKRSGFTFPIPLSWEDWYNALPDGTLVAEVVVSPVATDPGNPGNLLNRTTLTTATASEDCSHFSFDFDIPEVGGYDPASAIFNGRVSGHVEISRVPCPTSAGAFTPGIGLDEAPGDEGDENYVAINYSLPDCLRDYGGGSAENPHFICFTNVLVWDGSQGAWVTQTNTGWYTCFCDDPSLPDRASTVEIRLDKDGTISFVFRAPDGTVVCRGSGPVTVVDGVASFSLTCSAGACAGATIDGTVTTPVVTPAFCWSGGMLHICNDDPDCVDVYAPPITLTRTGTSSLWSGTSQVHLGPPVTRDGWYDVAVIYDDSTHEIEIDVPAAGAWTTGGLTLVTGQAPSGTVPASGTGWGFGYVYPGGSNTGGSMSIGQNEVTSCPVYS